MRNRNVPLVISLMLLTLVFPGGLLALQQPGTSQEAVKAPATLADLEPFLTQVASYKYGQDRKPLAAVIEFVRNAYVSGKEVPELEKRLVQMLSSAGTEDGKRFVCEQLSLIGTAAAVPVLSGMLADPKSSDMARYALERISDPEASEALVKALSSTTGKVRIGVINSLGRRGDSRAPVVGALKPFISNRDEDTAVAAITAVGFIGNVEAAVLLADARRKASSSLRLRTTDAYLNCAERMAKGGDRGSAVKIYQELNSALETPLVQIAALRGIAALEGAGAKTALVAALDKGRPVVQAGVVRLLAALPGEATTGLLVERYGKLPPSVQAQVLSALVDRGDPGAKGLVQQAASSPELNIRVAAIEGMSKVGDSSAVVFLAERAANTQDPEKGAARFSLYRLAGADVDQTILGSLEVSDPKVKTELIRAIGERRIYSGIDALLKAAGDANSQVRRESFRALRETAGAEQMPQLVSLLVAAKPGAERTDAEAAVVAVIRRSENRTLVDQVASALPEATDPEAKSSLLLVLGTVGSRSSLPLLKDALKSTEDDVRRGAILGLSQWPGPEPIPDLLEVAKNDPSETHRVLALRAYIRLVARPRFRSRSETAKMLGEALKIAQEDAEKRAVLAALPDFASPEALQLAEGLKKEANLAGEANVAVEKIKTALAAQPQR